MTTHGLQRNVDDLLRGRRPTRFARTILSHSTFLRVSPLWWWGFGPWGECAEASLGVSLPVSGWAIA